RGDLKPRPLRPIDQVERADREIRDDLAIEGKREIGAVAAPLCARRLVDAVAMGLGSDCEPERGALAIEKAIAQVERDALEIQLSPIVDVRDAGDVIQRDGAADLDAEVRQRHDLDLGLLTDGAIRASALPEAARRLALKFAFAEIADIGADHEAE